MDPRLEFLLKRHNVLVKVDQPISRDAYMSRLPSHAVLALRAGLAGPELAQAVAVQVARLALGHLSGLDKSGDDKLAEWRAAVLEAAKMLIPDEAVSAAEAEGWGARELAERTAVTELLAQARLEDRLLRELSAQAGAEWDALLSAMRDRLG